MLLLPLAAFAMAPLVRGPLFASADGLLHLYRLVEFDQGIHAGILYPRWAPDLLAGYGYPIFIFYAPLLYYAGEVFHLLGLGFADALKASVAAGMLASALGMFVFARDLWGRWGGFLAAAAYLYVPYRLVNTYLDGELSQTLAWAWLPWLAWAAWCYLREGQMRFGVLAAVCYGGLVLTHSVTSWLATLFLGLTLVLLLVCRAVRLGACLRLGGFFVLGTGLAAPYWLPALSEQANVQLDRVRIAAYDFHTNLVPLDRVLGSTWAHDYSGYVGVNGPSQLGLMQLAAAAAAMAALILACWRLRTVGALRPALLFALLAALAFVLMLKPAAAVWEHVPFGRFLQFPDRLLAVMGFSLALVTGSLAAALRRLPPAATAACSVAMAGLLAWAAAARLEVNYLSLPDQLGPAQVTEYEQVSGAFGTTAKGEFTPRWLGPPPPTSPLIGTELSGRLPTLPAGPNATATITQRGPELLRLTVSASTAGPAELPVAYYPGWTATIGGSSAAVAPSLNGLLSVAVPAGQSQVELRFGTTSDRRLGDALGIASLAALLGLAAVRRPRLHPPAAAGEGIAALCGALVLWPALALAPGKLDLTHWPAQRPELVSYAGWLQMIGADVSHSGDHVHVSTVFRTGNEANTKPVTATVRLMTHDTVWASASQVLPPDGWTTAVPRRFDYDLALPPGTPSGVYLLELELRWVSDNGILGQEWTQLSYGTPRVGTVTLGPLSLDAPETGDLEAQPPAATDFGPLALAGWQPPTPAEQGQYVPINLWWRPKQGPTADWGISLHVVDGQGRVWAGHDGEPRQGYNPTSTWPAGELQRDVQMALLPGGMPPGEYTVQAGWYDVATKAPVGPQNVAIGRMAVVPSSHPDADLLDIPHRLKQALPQGLTFLGYDLASTNVTAGQRLPLRLFWQTAAQPSQDYNLTLSFGGRSESLPLPATSRWQAGQLMELRLDAPIPADWSGTGQLSLSVGGSEPVVTLPEALTVAPLPRLASLPPDLRQVQPNQLGDAVQLAGYRETVSGARLELALYWQARGALPGDLVVFAHVLDAQNRVAAQHDGVPGGGLRPTATWAPGEYVEDIHEIELPANPAGLQVEVGLYDPASGQRLGDRLLLGLLA